MGRIEGKVAILTGGASGIGRATCLLLAKDCKNFRGTASLAMTLLFQQTKGLVGNNWTEVLHGEGLEFARSR